MFKSKKLIFKLLLCAPVLVVGTVVWTQNFEAQAQQTLRNVDEKNFFEKVRKSMHRRGMTDIQFQTYKQIINYWNDHPGMDDRRWLAYVMATAYHETQLRPVREGFKTSDAAARKHVRWMYNKRIIVLPYHRPDPKTGHVYYGRGYVQLTWAQNYKKMGTAIGMGDKLYRNPDLVLNPDIASKVLFVGMLKGHFRYSKRRRPKGKQRLALFFNKTQSNWRGARNIINGDLRKNGNRVAGYGKKYNRAIRFVAAPDKPPVEEDETDIIATPGEGEVSPSLPETDVTDAQTPDTGTSTQTGAEPGTGTSTESPPPTEDTTSSETGTDGAGTPAGTTDSPTHADPDTAGEVVPVLPESGEETSGEIEDGSPAGEQTTDIPDVTEIDGPVEGGPEVTPIGIEDPETDSASGDTDTSSDGTGSAPGDTDTSSDGTGSPPGDTDTSSDGTGSASGGTDTSSDGTGSSSKDSGTSTDDTGTPQTTPPVEDGGWWSTIKSYFAKAGSYVWKF